MSKQDMARPQGKGAANDKVKSNESETVRTRLEQLFLREQIRRWREMAIGDGIAEALGFAECVRENALFGRERELIGLLQSGHEAMVEICNLTRRRGVLPETLIWLGDYLRTLLGPNDCEPWGKVMVRLMGLEDLLLSHGETHEIGGRLAKMTAAWVALSEFCERVDQY